jgi:hypothetical protein
MGIDAHEDPRLQPGSAEKADRPTAFRSPLTARHRRPEVHWALVATLRSKA